jgi:hypothetical protein
VVQAASDFDETCLVGDLLDRSTRLHWLLRKVRMDFPQGLAAARMGFANTHKGQHQRRALVDYSVLAFHQ